MEEDATLEEFLGSDHDRTNPGEETEIPTEPADDAETASIRPAETTFASSRVGGTCDVCGSSVQRRWQQDGQLVCPSCKEW